MFLVPPNPWQTLSNGYLYPTSVLRLQGCQRAGNGQKTKFFKVGESQGILLFIKFGEYDIFIMKYHCMQGRIISGHYKVISMTILQS